MQVGLCPKSDFHSVLAGIIAQAFQVGDVAVQCFRLSIACAVAVIREQPAEGHVVVPVAVDNGTCRELVVVFLTVQGFFDAAVVFLALLITFSVFEEDSFLILFPIVTVVGVEMPFVETEFGQQDGISRQLVKIIQQGDGSVVDHVK